MAGLFGSYDPIAEMRPSRIKRASSDIQKVLDQIKESCNPFCSAVSETLYYNSGKLFPHQYRPVYWPYEIRESWDMISLLKIA